MKNSLSESLCTFMTTEIKKKYDTETVLKRKDSSSPYASIHFKGEFAVTPLQIAIAATVICGFCIVTSIAKKKKKK